MTTSYQEVLSAIALDPGYPLPENLSSLLIVDDVVASGRTVSAVVRRMRDAIGRDLEVFVATPLWAQPPAATQTSAPASTSGATPSRDSDID